MNYCCIFPFLDNNDITKHVGLIPYYLSKDFGYDATLVSLNNDEYTNADKISGVNLKIIDKKFRLFVLNYIFLYIYLIRNAKKIDVLHCFHATNYTFIFFLIYKILNRNGVTMFILDINCRYTLKFTGKEKNIISLIKTKIFPTLFKYLVDIATIETKKTMNGFVQYHDIYKEKLMYMPVFVDPNPDILEVKKNQVIYVGRIGARYKASDIVMESFKRALDKTDDKSWILKMVGPISEEFEEYIDDFFSKYPSLMDSIVFTGNINDKDELYKIYSESKIFCLPSQSESFGIAFVEALFYGDYLIVSPVGVADYLVEISDYGQIVEIDNIEDISNKLADAIENYDKYSKKSTDFMKLMEDEFSYRSYLGKLDFKIRQFRK